MTEVVQLTRRSAHADRLRALAPRIAVFGALGVLSLNGLRSIVEAEPSRRPLRQPATRIDQGAQAFAEGFARAYLSFDSARTQRRERELAVFLSDELEPDGGLSTTRGSRTVSWTAIEGDRVRGRRHTVTVAAGTSAGVVHLAVPVERDERGFLRVPAYPAVVGPPATNTAADSPDEDDVEDAGLRTVAERAVRNYLAGEQRDLLADLAPEAVVSFPAERLRVRSAEEITWAQPRRVVAVLAEAVDERGGAWTLRYELSVRKRDRWYVRSLHVDPTQGGGPR